MRELKRTLLKTGVREVLNTSELSSLEDCAVEWLAILSSAPDSSSRLRKNVVVKTEI